MSDKCPFCGEPGNYMGASIQKRFRCGTQGPDINGDYDVGHTCDIRIWTRLLKEKDAEIKRLQLSLNAWEESAQHGHPSPCNMGELCPYCEIERLRKALDETRSEAASLRNEVADAFSAGRGSLHATIAKQATRIEALESFVADQPCECLDEYGNPKPKTCERCRLFDRKEDEPS